MKEAIIIEVHLILNLEEFVPDRGRKFTHSIMASSTVLDLIRELQLPDEEFLLIVVNGVEASLETKLKNGDLVKFFPVIAGG